MGEESKSNEQKILKLEEIVRFNEQKILKLEDNVSKLQTICESSETSVKLLTQENQQLKKDIKEVKIETKHISTIQNDISLIKNSMDYITKALEKLEDNVEKMSAKPEKRYDQIITSIIMACVGAFMAYILKG